MNKIFVAVLIVLAMATTAMAQSRSHVSIRITPGGTSYSYNSCSGPRSWGYHFDLNQHGSRWGSYSRTPDYRASNQFGPYGGRVEFDTYGRRRHSSDFTLEWRNPSRGCGGYVPHGAERYYRPPVIILRDAPRPADGEIIVGRDVILPDPPVIHSTR